MVLLNFGFTNIDVKKGTSSKGKVNVKSGMNISDVRVSKAIQKGEQTPFKISFSYTVDYKPSNGHIKLEGDLLYLAASDLAEQIQKNWEDKKTLPQDVAVPIYNKVLHNSTVEALLLSREVGLPAPMQLPKLQMKQKGQEAPAPKKSATKNTPKKK